MEKRVFKICLTGGPKGGKSTVIEYLQKYLKALGYDVITVPETATLMRKGGIPIQKREDTIYNYQSIIYRVQTAKEYAADIASRFPVLSSDEKNSDGLKPTVILYDRGVLDNRAYLSDSDFESIASQYGDNLLNLANKYDCVIALNSCSNLEGMYSTENGQRVEDQNTAKMLDERTIGGYMLADNLFIVDAVEDMEVKLENVRTCVDSVLSDEIFKAYKRGYISQEDADINITANNAVKVEYEAYCKETSGSRALLEKRTLNDKSIYCIKCVDLINSSEVQTCYKVISKEEFDSYLSKISFDYKTTQEHFVYYKDNHVWKIKKMSNSLCVLELEPTYQNNQVNIEIDYPSFKPVNAYHFYKSSKDSDQAKLVRKK